MPVLGNTFRVLPAGTWIEDPCRLLRKRALGTMVARLRQTYDLIIIDSPPVLRVPDALLMGRCADCTWLTTRYDLSRCASVTRALHVLHSRESLSRVFVINETRNSYFSNYPYTYKKAEDSDMYDI